MASYYAIASVLIVSLLSLTGALFLAVKKRVLERLLLYLVSFSAGALLGGAIFHLIPRSYESLSEVSAAFGIVGGFLMFFVLEKFLRWRHCHEVECPDHPKHLGQMNLVGDAFHNFIDGVLIGASYLVSIPLGVATSLAVLFHEIPQEIGDFGVLIHSGYSRKKALWYNLLSALVAVLGTLFAIIVGSSAEGFVSAFVPITAGGFIYIAASGLIPELHKEDRFSKNLLQLVFLILGMLSMYALTFLE